MSKLSHTNGPKYPLAFELADTQSLDAQRRVLRATAIELSLLGIAAANSARTWSVTLFGHEFYGSFGISAICLLAALVIRIRSSNSRAYDRWFYGRATAESIKTLAWRYVAVGDSQKPASSPGSANNERELTAVMQKIANTHADAAPTLSRPPIEPIDIIWISDWMRQLHSQSLELRMACYLTHRVRDQILWYRTKAAENARRHKIYSRCGTSVLSVGSIGAALATFGVITFDALGVAAAVVAGIQGWQQLKQYKNLSLAYDLAASDLESALVQLSTARDEDTWARLVNETEEAISREHTSWIVTRMN
jgi:hypothetical protein